MLCSTKSQKDELQESEFMSAREKNYVSKGGKTAHSMRKKVTVTISHHDPVQLLSAQ